MTSTTSSCAALDPALSTVEVFFALAQEDIRDACDVLAPVFERTAGVDGYVSLEVDPTLAYDREATFAQAIRFHEEVARPNLYVKIPATRPGLGAIEDCIAQGRSINVTLIFSLERYAAVLEAYVRGARAQGGGRWRPRGGLVGRELLRLPGRHRGGPTPRRGGSERSAGPSRRRERQARLRPLAGGRPRAALAGARGEGRASAALPLGLDLHEEPGLPRRRVRRGADREGHRQHDARRDRRRVPRPRRGAREPGRGRSPARRRCSSRSPRRASTTTTSSRPSRPRASQKFADSFVELLAGLEAKRATLRA